MDMTPFNFFFKKTCDNFSYYPCPNKHNDDFIPFTLKLNSLILCQLHSEAKDIT